MSENINNIVNIIGSDILIGRYKLRSDGSSCLTDIRGLEGDILTELLNDILNQGGEPEAEYMGEPLKEDEFYEFHYKFEGDPVSKMIVDGKARPVDSRTFLQRIYDARSKGLANSNLELFNNFQKTILNEVTGALHTYIYELLQNANDYPYQGKPVAVQFILGKKYLFFFHSGAYFNLRNIAGISSVNQGEKANNTETIGYKGIGFKTVFVKNDYVYLKSGEWSLRFDEKYTRKTLYRSFPWTMMPIPTDESDLDDEIRHEIENADTEMRVLFALHHKFDVRSNIQQLNKVFSDNQILLFIPNVYKVDIRIDGETKSIIKDRTKWVISSFSYPVPDDMQLWVKNNVNTGEKIPEKFENIKNVRISYAIARDGKRLVPLENARVYNYLPTELYLGLTFLINADFVPNASRSGLHDVEWNNRIMEQCGHYFADLWASFMSNEDEYDLNSVLDLLPDFSSRDKYTRLFVKGFSDRLKEIPCIPTKRDGYHLCKLEDVLYDHIEFIASSEPILSDEEFYEFSDTTGCIPHPSIRCNTKLLELLRRFNLSIDFTNSQLGILCFEKDFREWLSNTDNNISFIGYLLKNEFIMNYWDYKIFLNGNGTLGTASSMYYDIDKYVADINFLTSNLPCLNVEVRNELENKYVSWAGYRSRFRKFNEYEFSKSVLDNFDHFIELFRIKENNIHFIHFLAVTKYHTGLPDTYPIFLEDGSSTTDISCVFVRNSIAESFIKHPWVDSRWIKFLDDSYLSNDSETIKYYLSTKCKISAISYSDCYNKFIADENKSVYISKCIKQKSANIDFYHYLTMVQDVIGSNTTILRKYELITTDGFKEYFTPISQTIFWNDRDWKDMAERKWMPSNCCLAVSKEYFEEKTSSEPFDIRTFFASRQFVKSFSAAALFNSLKKRLDEVFSKIDSIDYSNDFLDFLFRHRHSLFYDKIDPRLKSIPVACHGLSEMKSLSSSNVEIFIFDDELIKLYNQPWFNKTSLLICDELYEDLFDVKERREFFQKLGFKCFSKVSFVRTRILNNIDSLRPVLKIRSNNIAFHQYLSDMHSQLSDEDFDLIKAAPIYISSPNKVEGILVDGSDNHYLSSQLLTDIISKDLVPISILDTIHPDYIRNEKDKDYFIAKLDNSELHLSEFLDYIVWRKNEVYTYLRDTERNIRFWRWACDIKGEAIKKSVLGVFPIMGREEGSCEDILSSPSELYISDKYNKVSGLEELISEFVDHAKFVSPIYKDNDDTRDWFGLFKSLKVTVEPRDIVFNNILNNLQKYQRTTIIPIIAQYIETIERKIRIDKDEMLRNQLSQLQLSCEDGLYRTSDKVLVSGRYFDVSIDPLPELKLGHLVSEVYIDNCKDEKSRRNVIRLITLLADIFSTKCETATQLRNYKIEYFCRHQMEFAKSETHYRIIGHLAELFSKDYTGIESLIRGLGSISLFTTTGKLVPSGTLYVSSIYKPDCDYMANGIMDLPFISEKYAQYYPGEFKHLFRALNIFDGFRNSNIAQLKYPRFAKYFWETYAPDHESSLKYICTKENLEGENCIPTRIGVKTPREVYDYRISQLKTMVLSIEGAEDRMPIVTLPNWVDRIGLRSRLSYTDCFKYLKTNNIKFRRDVMKWISDTPEETISRFKTAVDDFIDSADWYSGAKVWTPLKSLYALEWGNKTLKDNFGNNSFVCNPSYMPDSKQDYEKLCNLLHIRILSNNDFHKKRVGNYINDNEARSEFTKRLLYLAYKTGSKDWESIYKEYLNKLNSSDISLCERIEYYFNDNISTDLQIYSEESGALWYVGGWKGPMFLAVLEWIKNKLEIKGEFDQNFLNKLFLEPFSRFVKNQEGGILPEDILQYLEESDKSGFTVDKTTDEGFNEEIDRESINASSSDKTVSQSEQKQSNVNNENEQSSTRDSQTNKSSEKTSTASSEIINSKESNSQNNAENLSINENDKPNIKQTNIDEVASPPAYIRDGGYVIHHEGGEQHVGEHVRSGTWVNSYYRSDGTFVSEHWRSSAVVSSHYRDSAPFDTNHPYSIPSSGNGGNYGGNTEYDSKQQSPVIPLEEKLQEKWQRKANIRPGRPSSSGGKTSNNEFSDSKPQNQPSSEGPFFKEPEPSKSSKTNRGMSRTSQKIRRRNTEAQETANKAAEQEGIFDLLNQSDMYSYKWYKYLMELQYSDRTKVSTRSVKIDFSEFKFRKDNTILSLSKPSDTLPTWFENSDYLEISGLGEGYVKIMATILKVNSESVELLVKPEFRNKLEGTRKVRVYAEYSSNFIDSLQNRFLQLDYEDDFDMRRNLPQNLEFIYGPPGTGKTTRLVERLHDIILNNQGGLNILVLTPTNKAADVIAIKLSHDNDCLEYLTRYGTTESQYLSEDIAVVLNRDNMDMNLLHKNIVVTTAARYAYDCVQPDNTAICDFNWDFIVVDEASMIDLVTITYIIYKGIRSKFIISGDPKQIEPIKQNDVEAYNVYDLVELNSFKDAVEGKNRYPVETLMTQHRSVPAIGSLVSKFSYDGLVLNDDARTEAKPLQLYGMNFKEINFLGFKVDDFDLMYGLTAINESAFHLYSALFTYTLCDYFVEQITENYPDSKYTIGIVSPYKAEADAIQQLLDNKSLDTAVCTVTAGTVHKFQGDECDIMFVILNPPANITSGTHINNDNIINVAMSRARDYLFFVLPEGQLKGFNLKNRLGKLVNEGDYSVISCNSLEKVMYGNSNYIFENTNISGHLPVNVYYDTLAHYEVRINDNNLDIQINE